MHKATHGNKHSSSRFNGLLLFLFAASSFIIYVLTAQRTFSWWFGSSYPLTAITFGVHFPPGSLLLTILGWLVAQLPLSLSKAFTLNLFNGLLAVCACYLLMGSALMLIRQSGPGDKNNHRKGVSPLAAFGVAAGGLTLAFGETMWRYAVIFMPYALSALFTALILWCVLHWWRSKNKGDGAGWLFLIMLLFGLDFSVHRTNLLLLPGVFIWMLLCYPCIFLRLKYWFAGGFGLLIGLSFHLLIIPIAARNPIINASDPSNWSRFYYYISLQQYGGSWLVNMWPRNAAFFSVQLMDYWNAFRDNFLSFGGALALVPLLLFVLGIAVLAGKDRRLSFGMILILISSSLGAALYFNLPENYPYPMDRHYLPSFVIFSLIAAYGAGILILYLHEIFGRYGKTVIPLVLILVLSSPVKQIIRNYSHIDASKKFFAHDYALSILDTVDKDAVIFVAGDNYWPPLYLQVADDVRPDVVVLCTSLLNTAWYVKQTIERYPDLPLKLNENEASNAAPVLWQDSTVTTQVRGDPASFRLPGGARPTKTIDIHVPPTVAGQFIPFYDWLVLRLIEDNQWRRPIYFTSPPEWLQQYTRLEGLAYRLIPQDPAELNAEILHDNLFDRYNYLGFTEASIHLDMRDRAYGQSLARAFSALAEHYEEQSDTTACRQTIREMHERIFMDRLDLSDDFLQSLNELCP
jgi:hypothetical protein